MHPEQENFDSLRRLLVLKRHEQPPPRYFQDFSGHVIARIRAGERDRSGFWANLSWEAPWLQRIWGTFETQPILAGVLGMATCGLLVAGVVFSENGDPNVATISGPGNEVQVVKLTPQTSSNPLTSTSISGLAPDQSPAGLFDGIGMPAATLVKFTVPGGN